MIVREAIYSRLWQIAKASSNFATSNRRLRHWSDVGPAEQPALFMAEGGAHGRGGQQPGVPVIYTLFATFYIYAHSSDPYGAPSIVLHPLLDALEEALAPSPVTGVQQLGLPAMVAHAYINGKIETDEGLLGDQSVAMVPIEILCV